MHHLAILIKLEDYSIYIIETLIGNISFISWEHFASTSYKLICMHYTEVYIATYCSQLYSLVEPSVDHEEVVPIPHHLTVSPKYEQGRLTALKTRRTMKRLTALKSMNEDSVTALKYRKVIGARA